jgi:hypothetical protein
MARWSKVEKPFEKPLKWWYYKVLCEIGYALHGSSSMYYRNLHKLCAFGWNLYGQKLRSHGRNKNT